MSTVPMVRSLAFVTVALLLSGMVGADGDVDTWLNQLQHSDNPRVRAQAAEKLGGSGEARVVNPLLNALRADEDADVRNWCQWSLSKLGDVAVGPLVANLGSLDADLRAAASNALIEIGGLAVAAVAESLQKEDDWTRWTAAFVLGEIGDVRAIQPLVEALSKGEPELSEYAAVALAKLGPDTIASLIAALKTDNTVAQTWAAWALSRIGLPAVHPLANALSDPDARAADGASQALAGMGVNVIPPLMQLLSKADAETRDKFADAMVKVFVRLGTPSYIPLKQYYLFSGNPPLKKVAYQALVQVFALNYRYFITVGLPEYEDWLIEALRQYGHLAMADAYLACNNRRLEKAAHTWAQSKELSDKLDPSQAGDIAWGQQTAAPKPAPAQTQEQPGTPQ